MTSLEIPVHPLVEILTDAFASLIESGRVDVVHETGSDVVELQADEWTLHLAEWPIRYAFIALDTVSDSDAEHEQVLNAALGPRDLAALRASDTVLEGALKRGLTQTTDGVSHVLARILD